MRRITGASVRQSRVALVLGLLLAHAAGPASAVGVVDRTAPVVVQPAVPKPKPRTSPTSAPLRNVDGAWSYVTNCESGRYTGKAIFSGSGGNISGSGVSTKVTDLKVKGSRVTFTNSYNLFGRVVENWTGTLNSAGNGISGTISDTTGDSCTFAMTR